MKPTKYDIRRRLGLREVPKPPEDLARRIKAEIPASFRYHDHVPAGRKGAGPAEASWGMSWQVAASFLALTIVGVGIYMVTWESQKTDMATTSIAEADGRESLEFAPPTEPSASPAAAAEAPVAQSRLQKSRYDDAYGIAAAPPPPPPPPALRARSGGSGTEAGVEGGVLGGVIGGAVDQPEDRAEKLADAQNATDRDKGFAEEKETLSAPAAPAPAASAQPGRRDAKDEQTRVTAVAQAPSMSAAGNSTAEGVAYGSVGADDILRVGGKVKAPVLIKRVEIVYPEKAKQAQVQGIVIVEAWIDRNGDVKNVRVLKPLPMGLDEAAVVAIKQWKFKPATLDGQPVDVLFNLTVNARLSR